jgi:hypothetical protein
MKRATTDDKLVENQVVFRKTNKRVSEVFTKFKLLGEQAGDDMDASILFFCECSDDKCKHRIEMKQSVYENIHADDNRFIVLPGHNIPKIERIVRSEDGYAVVEKFSTPPADMRVGDLNMTDLDFHNNSGKTGN